VNDLKRRLAAAGRELCRVRPRIMRIIIEGNPDGLTEGDAISGGINYHRMPGETVGAFRKRASDDAEARGSKTIIFGHGPSRPQPSGTDDKAGAAS
jgi:hypothetical protein